jgi:NAD(P)-dependent dehydrogenase (short-subunit alcohol dehydrogenase family)
MSKHALVIGGTGMLRDACLDLTTQGWTVSAVARHHAGLASLRQEAAARSGRPDALNPISVDYSDIASLALGLRSAAIAKGPFSLAIVWTHSTAPMAPHVIADVVASTASPCLYIHLVGCEVADPTRVDSDRDELSISPGIQYRRAILGFVLEANGSRWLTHREICSGVAAAIRSPEREQVIGVVTPWASHPPF